MNKLPMVLAAVLLGYIIGSSYAQSSENVNQTRVTQNLKSAPLAFTKNMGQWPVSQGQSHHRRDSVETTMVKAMFSDASGSVEVVGEDELDYKCNYFIGNDPVKWRTDVPNYSAIRFKGLYPGVDATFSGWAGHMECRFVAVTSGSLKQVRTEYGGAQVVRSGEDNLVTLRTNIGEKQFQGILPVAEVEDTAPQVGSTESATGSVVLVYSTYLGGSDDYIGGEVCWGIAVDGSGAAFVVGVTFSSDFPTLDPYQEDQGSIDVFVTKFSVSGHDIVYSTYLGGSTEEQGNGIEVDASGAAYITGWTFSTDFPTLDACQQTFGGSQEAFVTKLSSGGNSLAYSTFLGGSGMDEGDAIAVDVSGAAYVTGYTQSANFPTLNPFQETYHGIKDAFITKLSEAAT